MSEEVVVSEEPDGKVIVRYKGQEVWCYGSVTPYSALLVEATCEEESKTVSNGFSSWKEAIVALIDSGYFPSGIEEVSSDL